jgi:DNA (cytosine-5)-methyltransferase 1
VLRVLDLFSGIGGFSLGLERTGGFRTVAFCEIEPFPRKVLAKHWPDVPIFEDVRKLHAEDLPEPVDVICGGYPCQPFSIAGKRKGAEDDRHLWPEIARLLRELDAIRRKPAWCLFENVTGHVNLGLNQVLADLESQNYTAWPLIIPACAVGANHRRDRLWILANSNSDEHIRRREQGEEQDGVSQENREEVCTWFPSRANYVPNTDSAGLQKRGVHAYSQGEEGRAQQRQAFERDGWWSTEPEVGRVAHGVRGRMDRLKSLGNAVVPQVVEVIGRAILEAEKQNEEVGK